MSTSKVFGQLVAFIEKADDIAGETDPASAAADDEHGGGPPAATVLEMDIDSVQIHHTRTGSNASGSVATAADGHDLNQQPTDGSETPPRQRIGSDDDHHIFSSGDNHSNAAADDVPSAPQQPSDFTEAGPSALALAKKVAEMQVALDRTCREKAFLETQLAQANERLESQSELLRKVGLVHEKIAALEESVAAHDGGESSSQPEKKMEIADADAISAVREIADHVHHDVSDALDRNTRDPVAQLESVVQFHLVTISALEESNTLLRERLMSDEIESNRQLDKLRQEQREAATEAARFEEMTKMVGKRHDENALLVARITKLSTALQQKDLEAAVLRDQVETMTTLLTRRDEEIASMRDTSVVTQDVKSSKFFQHMNQSKWGQGVTRAATFVDRFSVLSGTLLKRNAPLRIFIAMYLLILHLYVFHVVTSVVHLMPHGVGSDAHDHIENHLHPGSGAS